MGPKYNKQNFNYIYLIKNILKTVLPGKKFLIVTDEKGKKEDGKKISLKGILVLTGVFELLLFFFFWNYARDNFWHNFVPQLAI